MKQSHPLTCFSLLRFCIFVFLLLFFQLSYSQSFKRDTVRLNALVEEIENKLSSNPDSAKLLIDEAKTIIKPNKQYLEYHKKIQLFSGKYFLSENEPKKALEELLLLEGKMNTCKGSERFFMRKWLVNMKQSYLMIGDSTQANNIYREIANGYLEKGDSVCYAVVYSELAYEYRVSNQFDKAIEYGKISADIAEKTDDYSALLSYLVLQNTYFYKQDYLNALRNAEMLLKYAEKMGEEEEIAQAKLNLGSIYSSINQGDKAIEYFFEVLPYFEREKDYERAGSVTNNIAATLMYQKKNEEAIRYMKKAIEFKDKSTFQKDHSLAISYNILGLIYNDMAEYGLAEQAFLDALEYSKKSDHDLERGAILKNLAHNFELKEDYESAESYYNRAFENLDSTKRLTDLADAYAKYGKFLIKSGKESEAIPYLENAIETAEKNTVLITRAKAHFTLSELYKKRGQHQKAYTHLTQYSEIMEEHRLEEEKVALEKANLKYEFEKERLEKDLEIQALSISNTKKKNRIKTITFLLLLLALLTALGLLLAGFFRYRNNKERSIAKMMTTQNEVLRDKNTKIVEQKEALLVMNDAIQENNNKLNSELKSKLLLISQQKMMTEKLEKAINSPSREFKRDLMTILKSQNSEDIWEKVEDEFLDTNKEFIAAMTKKFPSLTPNNIKTSILIKMGLSNKEIARIRYVEPGSVKVARNRLRKQFGISDSSITLYSFLNSIVSENIPEAIADNEDQ